MASADPARVRAIKIKTGVVKRLAKEKVYYEKETITNQERVDKMKKDGKDEYDIRKQEEVTGESKMMVPDCERKLADAWTDLTKLIDTEKDLGETQEYKDAVAILAETESMVKK